MQEAELIEVIDSDCAWHTLLRQRLEKRELQGILAACEYLHNYLGQLRKLHVWNETHAREYASALVALATKNDLAHYVSIKDAVGAYADYVHEGTEPERTRRGLKVFVEACDKAFQASVTRCSSRG